MVTADLAVVVGSQATHFHTALGVPALGAGPPPARGYTGRWGTPKSRPFVTRGADADDDPYAGDADISPSPPAAWLARKRGPKRDRLMLLFAHCDSQHRRALACASEQQ
jgi:hypothetical protein